MSPLGGAWYAVCPFQCMMPLPELTWYVPGGRTLESSLAGCSPSRSLMNSLALEYDMRCGPLVETVCDDKLMTVVSCG